MDRDSAYRARLGRCPSCDEPMRREVLPSSVVSVCDPCGGLFVDWFDGEVQTIASETEAARVDRGTPPPGAIDAALASRGSRRCPVCQLTLSSEIHRFRDASDDELVTGVEVWRCGECAGVFVPRSSAHLLLDRTREGRPPSLREAAVGLLRALFVRQER